MKTTFRFLLLLCFCFAILFSQNSIADVAPLKNAEEQFNESTKLFLQKEYMQSALLLRRLILADRKKSMYWFNFANCLYMLKRYPAAIKYFDHVIKLNAQFTVIAKINKAKSLVALGKSDQALLLLETVLSEPAPASLHKLATVERANIQEVFAIEQSALQMYQQEDLEAAERTLRAVKEDLLSNDALILLSMTMLKQNRKKEAEKFLFGQVRTRMVESDQRQAIVGLLKRARRAESFETPYWMNLDVATGMTDNVYVDGSSQALQASSLTQIAASVGYQFLKNQKLSYNLGYAFTNESPQAADSPQFANHTLSGAVRFEHQKLLFTATPMIQLQSWNNSSALKKTGLSATAGYQDSHAEYGTEASFYDKEVLDSEYNYLEGGEFLLRPYYGRWTENLYVQFSMPIGSDLSRDIQYSDGSVLPLNQNYFGLNLKAFWSFDKSNFLQSGLSVVQRKFKNPAQPSGKERVDQELAVMVKYNYYILPKLFIYATIDSVSNQSTLGSGDVRDKNYKTNTLSVGLNWDVFE